jgi:PPOX class probable F420-dependent enzyme
MLREERVGRLALLDDAARPRVLPITYAVAEGSVYTAVDDKPKTVPGAKLARVRFMRRRPEAAFLVDRYDDDWERLAWVQFLGTVEVLDVDAAPKGIAALRAKYEPYRLRAPAGPLVQLTPRRCLWWRAEDGPRPEG